MPKKLLITTTFLLCAGYFSFSQTLVHYWNFNQTSSEAAHLAPSYTAGGGALAYVAGGTSANDYLNGTGQNFDIQNLNARNGDAAGNHLRINNPIGASLIFGLPTTGFQDAVVKLATRRSGSGAGAQVIWYTTNGSNYDSLTTIAPNNGDPTLQTFDFSAISATDNNPNFKIKITFLLGSGGTVGNNRFDNVTLDAAPAGADVLPPSVNILPANGAMEVAVNAKPTITFNEPVRKIDNTPVDNTNVDALVILKQGNASGADVPFDATIAGNTITITPAAPLGNSQPYYVALKANVIEDLSDNAIASVQSSTFTTISSQTIFNAGDILLVAYQMNAVPNDDRIAFVTFVDILAGTNIVFTDAKHTTNTPAQCPNGITWTAPAGGVSAGTVVTINNDAGTASTGTITGSTFGLSANGDQVIVYAGSNTSPNYITALSSNAWLAANTSCSGSFSMLPASLTDGINSINLSTAPGNTAGNTVNAYYTGTMTGTPSQLRALITNPANWTGTASGTPAQTWPAWAFPGPVTPSNTTIAFSAAVLSVSEAAGQATIQLNLTNPSTSSVDLVVKTAPFNTAGVTDFTLSTQTLHFTADSSTTKIITVPIIDDGTHEQDEYFVLSLENPAGLTINGSQLITVYIRDNDRAAPVPTKQIALNYIGSYDPSGASNASSEIVVYDSATRRLFVISALQNRLDIADFSNPASIQPVTSVDMLPYGGITSVAVKNGIVAVAAPNANQQLNGSVVFFNTNGVFQKQVTVGALPDMITFTPDGKKVMTANEGQPNDSYTVDPEGSVSIIDISGGIASLTQAQVTTLDFTAFNAQAAALIAAGVRKGFPASTLSQDLEPEYITITPDSKKAWVILQEANAFAVIDLVTNTVTDIWPLGKKDHNLPGNGFDASDRGSQAHIANWPVKGLYMPDGIANYTVNGTTYIVGANEGDDREYSAFNERVRVNAATYVLDSATFPNAKMLKDDNNLGRLRVTTASGDTDGDGDFDEIYLIGGRSFSIWNTTTQSIVYDSKDDFEQYLSKTPLYNPIFNADHESNTRKSRSSSKGPEPEGLALATIGKKQYAFVGLERQGGIMVYDITDPAGVKFVDYNNPRNLASFGGDNGPEGIFYIPGTNSPDGAHYIVVANEISGTLSVYRITGDTAANKPPVVHITAPMQDSTYQAGKTIAFTANATDADGQIVKVEFFADGVKLGEDSAAPYQFTAAEVEPATYVLIAKATDNNGSTAVSDTLRVNVAACEGSGSILAEGYANIEGPFLENLFASPKYPGQPDVTMQLDKMEYGPNVTDSYGARLRGYVCAPQTGNYIFYIAGDDRSELWLSTDSTVANKRKIAFLNSWVSFRDYQAYFTQKSAQIFLVKGVKYYIEALHKESTGSDHLSVAWVLPNGTMEAPVAGNRLAPYETTPVSGSRIVGNDFKAAMREAELVADVNGLVVKASPNPSTGFFTLMTRSSSIETLSITLTDVLGRVVERRMQVPANGTLQIGSKLLLGVYFVEVAQGTQKEKVRLVKQ
jgi:hypothetical protein